MKENKIRIAIQKGGRLQDPSLKFLRSLGLKFKLNGRELIVPCTNAEVELLFVRNSDIPEYVKGGVADFGIVGENVLFEKKYKFEVVRRLGFGKCSLIIAAPEKSEIKESSGLEGERIATSYPNSLRAFLKKKGVNAAVIEIRGSVEIAPSLDLADAICDITQTGNTLRENGLAVIDKIIDSEAVLVKSLGLSGKKRKYFSKFLTNAK